MDFISETRVYVFGPAWYFFVTSPSTFFRPGDFMDFLACWFFYWHATVV